MKSQEGVSTTSFFETDLLILLSEGICRQALWILDNSSGPLTDMELAKRIATREYENPTADEVKSLHLALHNVYLPQLDESGIVEYDVNAGTVRIGLNFNVVISFLEGLSENDLPWSAE